MRRILSLAFILSLCSFAVAQEKAEEKKIKATSDIVVRQPYRFNPSIGAGIGVTRFFGDIEDVNPANINRIGNRLAYDFTFKANLSHCLNLSMNTVFGKISGNENEHRLHRNFESKVFSLGLNLEYNFNHFYQKRKKKAHVTPFVSAGVYYADYNPRSDVYSSNGNLYYYWDDGNIHDMPQDALNSGNAQLLDRDYDYETFLTEKPVASVAFPVAGGLDFHLSDRFSFRLNASYFFVLNDKVDNFNDGTFSERNDGYYYNSLSVFFHFMKPDKIQGFDPPIYFVDFDALDEEDSDNDGVVDINDNCPNTPSASKVNVFGCPLDIDRDGIADYLDKEPNSRPGSIVDINGVTINYDKVAENNLEVGGLERSLVTDEYVNAPKTGASNYTVHVATVDKNTSPEQIFKLTKLEGLIQTPKDTLTIFTLGNFSDFKEAEKKQNELLAAGYNEAFAAKRSVMDMIAIELEKREQMMNSKTEIPLFPVKKTPEEGKDAVKFKVQLTEYRMRLKIDKLTDLMAREGVELITTTGGLKLYNIGAYNTIEEAQKIRKEVLGLGVKDAEIIGWINDKAVSVKEAKKFIEEQNKNLLAPFLKDKKNKQ